MRKICPLLSLLLLSIFPATGFAVEAYQVTAKAWNALGRKDWNAAISHANHAIKVWGAQARQINSKLGGFAPAKDARKYTNLNEVGTCLLLKGDALRQKGDAKGAIATYELLLRDYQYAQVWDPKGWFWKPAESARKSLAKLKEATAPFKLKVAKKHFTDEQLKFPGKKGICLTMRQPGKTGSAEENLPRLKKVNPYWSYSWGWDQVPNQPANVEFVPMAWGAWSVDGLSKGFKKRRSPYPIGKGQALLRVQRARQKGAGKHVLPGGPQVLAPIGSPQSSFVQPRLRQPRGYQ